MTRGVWCVALWLVAAVAVAATEPTAVWRAPAAILPRIDSIEDTAQQKRSLPSAVHVLIGVKTSLVHGASSRRAIRETWGSLASPDEARVVFLGCSPDLTQLNASDAERMQREIAQETQRYGDLLVHELVGCRDAYEELANKVLAFFQWTTSQRQPRDTKAFVMVVDDDVYLRIDLLLRLLQDPRVDKTRFYGGQVWAAQYGRAMEPYRKPQHHKYYLSYDQYPMSQLPPFANGPHYIASADIAAFLGSHRDMFHGVGGHRDGRDGAALDDVSMALWLLAMQIHPMHLPQFQNLRDSMCRNELVSYADISVDGLRHIHNNLMQNRSFCDGFTYATWLKRSPSNGPATRPDEDLRLSSLTISWHSELDALTDDVHVSLELRTIEKSESVRINYVPAQASVFSVCEVAYDLGNAKSVIRDISMNAFCRQFIAALRVAATHAPRSRVLYALVLHNLQSDVVIPTLVIRMSPMPRSAKSVIECLLTQAYRGAEVLMFDETANTAVATFRPPEIVFFTLEGKGDEMQSPDAIVDAMSEKYPSSRLVLVLLSHHHASIKSTRVVVLSLGGQLTSSDDARAISITAASVSFGASELFTPCDLLEPFHSRENVVAFSQDVSTSAPFQFRRFCVDHYTQPDECYLPHREYFSRLMNAMDTVDTIGACARAQHLGSNATSRLAFDRLVESYRNFRFVIAFENSVRPFGEINDKIVAAFLAGAIPIYYGHSETYLHAFNPHAYVNCGSFESLRACASYVHVIHSSPRLYERMRQEVPISNTTAFVEIFSWHPAVSQFALENQHVGIKTAIQQLKERLDQS